MSDKSLIDSFFSRGIDSIYPSEKAFRAALATGKRMRFYLGADPSRPDLHIGHAVVLRRMKVLQDMGHEIIFLIGDFTGRIGDPTGKDTARTQMTPEQVLENAETYKEQITKIFDFEGDNPAKIMFNSEWNDKLRFDDVIKLAAKFTVQQMIERDMYQKRLKEGTPIYLHEFFYPLMQGYDSVAMDVDGEFGGTDQMFNMMAGRTLLKEMKNKEKFVIMGKLLVGSDGRKMSKSYDNYVALNDEPRQMYGKLMSIRDDLIAVYMELCTDIPLDEVASVKQTIEQGTVNPRDPKMRLAREVTRIYWGEQAAADAEQAFVSQFQKHELPTDIPKFKMQNAKCKMLSLLVECGLADSNAEAKRLIKQGAVRIDGEKFAGDATTEINITDGMVVQVGKLNFRKIKLA
ncbi:MAG TPA: tyrosine--tRNA ligase [bacterium]|nr:tyrosine--tRNA ligase [bacterium]